MPNPEPAIQFPLTAMLRVIGYNSPEFAPLVLDILCRHLPHLAREEGNIHPSKDGRYVSVIVPVVIPTRAQYDAIYHELSQNSQVITVL